MLQPIIRIMFLAAGIAFGYGIGIGYRVVPPEPVSPINDPPKEEPKEEKKPLPKWHEDLPGTKPGLINPYLDPPSQNYPRYRHPYYYQPQTSPGFPSGAIGPDGKMLPAPIYRQYPSSPGGLMVVPTLV